MSDLNLVKRWATLLTALLLISPWSMADKDKEENADSEVEIIKSHAFAAHGQPKYGQDFTHFDYANPEAPKGGELSQAAVGSSYDSFNRYAQRGNPVTHSDLLDDTLMTPSLDELEVYYPLIAEAIEYPEDFGWVIFHIDPRAQDHTGTPLTAEDVAFSFEKFIEEGMPQYKTYFRNVEGVEVLDKHRVRFTFKNPGREEMIGLMTLNVLPKHFWEEKNLSEPLSEPPIGSGPYKVKDYKLGQQVTFERVESYWAADLPTRKGTMNFNHLTFEYFRDGTVTLEAFKAGEFDFREEHTAKYWAEEYDVPAVRQGQIVRETLEHSEPQRMQAFTFNTREEVFQDRRVRQAINYALDFDWLNTNIFYDQYHRTVSYFQNTEYMAEGSPSSAELEILKPFEDQLPKEVFGPVWRPEESDGSGNIRPSLRKAMSLLKEAGWKLQDGKLVHGETGKPLEFELLYFQSNLDRIIQPFRRNLERLGIDLQPRLLETSQLLNRIRSIDYEMISMGFPANPYPHSAMPLFWHSDYVETTSNRARVDNPVIDSLMNGIVEHQNHPEKLKAYAAAFDRVALWNFYVVPHWHSSEYRIAYWNKFSRPEQRPKYDLGLATWWYDEKKASSLR